MATKVELYISRSTTEIEAASILFQISHTEQFQDQFYLSKETTFYSAVIAHAYYAIFYAAKAMLLSINKETTSPNIHQATYETFEKEFITTGILDASIFLLYKSLIIRAEELLTIYKHEKKKRGDYTYNILPQANKVPAEESIQHAKSFLKYCKAYLNNPRR